MNIITVTSIANLKRNKSRNILIGIAILLTALLLTIVPTVIFGMLDVQFAAVEKVYPTFHAMYRNADEETGESLLKREDLETVGLREDPAYMFCEDKNININMLFCDDNTVKMNRLKLKEGNMPDSADEIVVSKGILDAMGLSGTMGDKITVPFQAAEDTGLGLTQTKEFTITGFTEDSEEMRKNSNYSAFVSKAFAQEVIPDGEHRYRVYFRLAQAKGMTTDLIKNQIEKIAQEYEINQNDIVNNGDYLSATYVDPAMYAGMVILMIIIVLAGILTIYSIYYVSMINKVQEYGKLKAIGAAKRQIRKLVFREGFAAAAIAIPLGLIIGTVTGVLIVHGMVNSGISADNMMAKYMKEVIQASGGVLLVKPWILGMAAVVSSFAVYISLLRPMQIASKITAIEAIRYQGWGQKKKAKTRKGYDELNIRKLTASNLGRNRKRTIVTIVTLGVMGIFFMVVATVLSCMNPTAMTEDVIRGDIHITVDSWSGDKMRPERELHNIQKNNPMTEELKNQILAIDGVKAVEEQLSAQVFMEEIREDNGEPLDTGVSGIDEPLMKEMEKYTVEGSVKNPKLYDGTGVILGQGYITESPGADFKIGDKVHLTMKDGDDSIQKELEIVAITNAPNAYAGNGFIFPSSVLQSFCKNRLTDSYNITAEKKNSEEVTETVKRLIDDQEFLKMSTYAESYEESEKLIGYMMYGCYGILIVFGLIGILNLINTMINSVHVRRRELGMLQAIGMSGKQLVSMLWMEGVFYTAGMLILSLGIGSAAGYLCFLWAKKESIMSVRTYHYPVLPAIIMIIVILLIQILITYIVNNNLKKASLIERIRLSE